MPLGKMESESLSTFKLCLSGLFMIVNVVVEDVLYTVASIVVWWCRLILNQDDVSGNTDVKRHTKCYITHQLEENRMPNSCSFKREHKTTTFLWHRWISIWFIFKRNYRKICALLEWSIAISRKIWIFN